VVKIPRWAFEKFRDADPRLGTQMKSVGEVMAIGRTFKERLLKGLRGLEIGQSGFARTDLDDARIKEKLLTPDPDRIFYVKRALDLGWEHAEIYPHDRDRPVVPGPDAADRGPGAAAHAPGRRRGPARGQAHGLLRCAPGAAHGTSEAALRSRRLQAGIKPVYKRVDTCAAEFESHTPYLYSTYESECEAEPTTRRKVMILGSGPNRIGQGIEFDYCCCHASFAFKEEGYETIMVNCNRRRCRPTTTPPTGCTSSRSPSKT
jgi:carbamoyl-phosphate synthase large subunit